MGVNYFLYHQNALSTSDIVYKQTGHETSHLTLYKRIEKLLGNRIQGRFVI